MHLQPLRLHPDQDLRAALCDFLRREGLAAAFVVAGIGSLKHAAIRYADDPEASEVPGPLEILTLSGTLSPDGAHLHIGVADAAGKVCGGHLGSGSLVRTTAEVLIAPLPDYVFAREPDAETGYRELAVRRR